MRRLWGRGRGRREDPSVSMPGTHENDHRGLIYVLRYSLYGMLAVTAAICWLSNYLNAKWATCIMAMCTNLLSMAVFAVYDFYVRHETTRTDNVLDSKRRFVRFIRYHSH
jgi:hypothetical protein